MPHPFPTRRSSDRGRPIEGRGEERACRVRLMMLGEKQRFLPAAAAGQLAKLVPKSGLLEHLFLDPQRNGHAEGVEAARRGRKGGFKQEFEFQQWLIVKNEDLDAVTAAPGHRNTMRRGRKGKGGQAR